MLGLARCTLWSAPMGTPSNPDPHAPRGRGRLFFSAVWPAGLQVRVLGFEVGGLFFFSFFITLHSSLELSNTTIYEP